MNLRVRFKNPVFWFQILLSVFAPILTYMGLNFEDLTTWAKVGEVLTQAIMNPYVLATVAISVWNALNDPTTKGLKDSKRALTYDKPNED